MRRRLQSALLVVVLAAATAPAAARATAAAKATDAPKAADSARNLTCAPSPEVKALLATVPRRDADCDPADPCWVEKIRKAEALVDSHPFDVHVHRRYQDLITARSNQPAAAAAAAAPAAATGAPTGQAPDAITQAASDRYRRFVADHPDDPLPHYLLARFTDDKAEAEKAFALNPTFPWPHALLATLLRGNDPQPTSEASVAAGAEIEAFARLCPNRFDEVLRRDSDVGDAALWRRLLPPVREALQKGPPDEQLPWYSSLWDHEFHAWPPAEHDKVRRRVRDDVTRIESWKRRDDERWWRTLLQGYKMIDDPQGLERIQAAYVKRFPCTWEGVEHTVDAFVASRGGQEHLHDQTQEQWRDTYEKTGRWLRTCPDDYRYMSYHFEAAARLDSTDDRAIVAEADRYLAGWERIASDWTVYPTPHQDVAAEFLSRGIEPTRALELARKAREVNAAARQASEAASAGDDASHRKQHNDWNGIIAFDSAALVAEATLASGSRQECDAALAEAGALYRGFNEAQRALEDDTGSRSRYWRVRARLAEGDGHPADALAFWRQAVEQANARSKSRTIAQDRASLDRLWRSLGGSDETFAMWMAPATSTAMAGVTASPSASAGAGTSPSASAVSGASTGTAAVPDTPGWDSPGDTLPPFSLTDLAGRTWTLADLSGKTLFINVWATWCGPCKAEIPHLRDLNDRLRDRRDVVLLSFNTDDSAGVVAPFARANKMTWPILFASTYFESLGGEATVPQNWVVDGAGVRRKKSLGFDAGHPDTWLQSALAAIDTASAAQATAPPPPHP